MINEEWFKYVCEEGPEALLYFVINTLGGFIWQMNHDMADFRIPAEDHPAIDKDVVAAQKQLEVAVDHATRFGVEAPKRDKGGPSEEYWRWFRWWDSYAKSLPQEEFEKLDKALTDKADVSQWRPNGDWRGV